MAAPFVRMVCSLEIQAHGHLARSRSSKIRTNGSSDQAKAWITDVHIRIAQVGVIQDVSEGTLGAQMHSLRNGKSLTEAGGEIDGARPYN